MSAVDFRRLVHIGEQSGVALEVDDPADPRPVVLTTITPNTAATLRLELDEARCVVDALAASIGLVEVAHAVDRLAGRDTRGA